MHKYTLRMAAVVAVLSVLSTISFAADCQGERSNWLKDRHACISMFRNAYSPEKLPKSGIFQMNNKKVDACFDDLSSNYPGFDFSGRCSERISQTMDAKFKEFTDACLHQADMSKCESVLGRMKPDNIRDGSGATLLMAAVQEGDIAAIDFLVENGASAKKVDHNANNLLHYALTPMENSSSDESSREESVKNVVEKVLALGVNPQELNLDGENAVDVALRNKMPSSVIEMLVKAGANVGLVIFDGEFGRSSMLKMIMDGNVDLIKKILNMGFDRNAIVAVTKNGSEMSILEYAIVRENKEIFDLMLRAKANVNRHIMSSKMDGYMTPLCLSMQLGATDMAAALIEAKADVSEKCAVGTPLEIAINKNDLETVKNLVRAKVNVNDSSSRCCPRYTMLELAESNGNSDIAAVLQKAGARKPFRGDFVQYCLNPNLTEKMVLEAIKQGADVNETESKEGWTPLHSVAQEGKDLKAMGVLIKRGAFVNAVTRSGMTPFLSAARKNPNPAFLKMLITAGADMDAKDADGWDALQWAVANNGPEVVSMLLKTKLGDELDPSYKNNLVIIAVKNNPNPKVLVALFKAGFKAEPESSWWDKPLYIALRERKGFEIIKVLLQGKAVVDNRAMELARDLPLETPEDRKARNQIIDILTKAKKR